MKALWFLVILALDNEWITDPEQENTQDKIEERAQTPVFTSANRHCVPEDQLRQEK